MLCALSQRAYLFEVVPKLNSVVTGIDLNEDDLYEIGHRINILERTFNVRE